MELLRMNVAVVGYGMMGQSHINAIKALGHSVKVVMGRDAERTKQFASNNDIPGSCVSFDELTGYNIDVLHICTPPVNHYELVKQAFAHRMHVICEKPFVLDDKEGEELVQLAVRNGLIGAVGFNVRFHEACRHAKAMIDGGRIGDVLLVHGSYLQEFHALPSFYSWRYQKEYAGRMLATTEIGSHWIDLMRYLTGKEIIAVSASFGRFFPERILADGMMYPLDVSDDSKKNRIHVDSDNIALLSFRLSDATLANVVLSEITPGRYNYLDMTITGTSGALWWNSEELNRLHIGNKAQPIQTEVLAFADGFNASVQHMLAAIYRDIEQGKMSPRPIYATFADGLVNTKICNAIYRSAHGDSQWEVIE